MTLEYCYPLLMEKEIPFQAFDIPLLAEIFHDTKCGEVIRVVGHEKH
ncbi:MAG: hypothetical protein JWQ50_8717 [Caballeronia mineralivorans]|jgi:hypothetical protein|nr:hypothetical protein [Caballeronia mineralivorans]MEA3099804.1 hypothetical protein [Caballeronia mineralivorans]